MTEPNEAMVDAAFLAVMNANDRQLTMPLSDHAGRNLLRRRIAVALTAALAAQPASDARPSGNDDLAGEEAWLIERNDLDGADRHYFYAGECGSHGWTDDVHKATRFETETLANAETNGGPLLRAVEHSWFSSTALRQPTAESGEPVAWRYDNPRDPADYVILADRAERLAKQVRAYIETPLYEATAQPVSRNAVLEEAAKACEEQQQTFLSPEYATGQPLSSLQERFACRSCADAIRALGDAGLTDDKEMG